MFYIRYKLYKYKILLFKLCNELALFQRFINNALMKYLDDFYTIYVDNILIYSDDFLEHKFYIKKVLDYLQTAELQVNIKKSELNIIFIKFLDFIISIKDILINLEKMTIIKNWKILTTLKDLQSFLRFCNFY